MNSPVPFLTQRTGFRAAWTAIALLLLLSFYLDFDNVTQGGAIDLRNRITGVRLLVHHLNPYTYKWHEPEPPEYADPYNNLALPVSKTTATPSLLLLHAPLGALPYRLAQFLWLPIQWMLLLGTTLLWLRRCPSSRHRLLVALFVTGFTYTAAWRLHAERGQSYVLLLFLFGLWLAGTWHEEKKSRFLTGFLAGFLVTLRPPFLLLFPFLALHRRGQLLGATVGLVLGLGLPLLWNPECWTQYVSAMEMQSSLYRGGIDPDPPAQAYPPRIEGIPTEVLANYVAIPYADFSIHSLLRWLGWKPFSAWPPLLMMAAFYSFWLWVTRARSLKQLLPALAAWFFLVDLFLPAYRNNYNDVLIINVVDLSLISSGRIPWGIRLCFLALPLGWIVLFLAPTHDVLINLPSMLFTVGMLLLLGSFCLVSDVRRTTAPIQNPYPEH